MKKIVLSISAIILSLGMILGAVTNTNKEGGFKEQEAIDSISEKIIRFHVLANSDSDEDQKLKLKVRDKVLEYIAPKLNESESIEQSREIIKNNDDEIKKIAKECILENGYSYDVATSLGEENFPVKNYGDITLPQGEYEAYRILIGQAKGQNWWCVMFPPLCFVDITKGQIDETETKKTMEKVLSDEEYKLISNKEKRVEFKFKVIEILNNEK